MKTPRLIIVLIIVGCIVSTGLAGCGGLQGTKVWQKGRYFTMHKHQEFEQREIKSIGIYVCSDGEDRDGSKRPYDAIDVLDELLKSIRSFSIQISTVQIGLNPKFFPAEVATDGVMTPDTSNVGPSLELAVAIKSELESRGYVAKIISKIGHNGDIPVTACIAQAKEQGTDAILIVNYAGLSKWTKFRNVETHSSRTMTIETTNVDVFEGYLYLSNAALFDVRNSDVLWKNSYYGLVENAHVFNLSNEPFHYVVNDALLPMGDESYFKAAPKAAKNIFEPALWPGSVQAFPSRKIKSKNL